MNSFPLQCLPQNEQYKHGEGAMEVIDLGEDKSHPTMKVSNLTWYYPVDEPYQPIDKASCNCL